MIESNWPWNYIVIILFFFAKKIYTFLYLIKFQLYRNLKTKHHLDRKFSTSIIYFHMEISSENIFEYFSIILLFLISLEVFPIVI